MCEDLDVYSLLLSIACEIDISLVIAKANDLKTNKGTIALLRTATKIEYIYTKSKMPYAQIRSP
jgi:hypothetical protein